MNGVFRANIGHVYSVVSIVVDTFKSSSILSFMMSSMGYVEDLLCLLEQGKKKERATGPNTDI